jgi:uncharacterized membrane protein
MKEFWFWVAIVTLIIFCLVLLSFVVMHTDKQLKKAEIILQRAEQLEKKRSAKIEPKPEKEE